MKIFLKISVALILSSMFFSACTQEEDTLIKEFLYTVGTENIMVGTPVVFTDLSLGVETRTWTFEDAEPATSTGAQPSVTFTSRGEKNCSLEIVFRDNTVKREEFTVNARQAVSGAILAEGLTPKGCAKKGATINFSIEDLEGDPDVIEWTFPGGTPSTSTSVSPSVVWNDQIDEVQVSVRLARTTDDPAEVTLTKTITAGNYPLLKADDRWSIDNFNFDKYAKKGPWFVWGATPEEPNAARHEDDLISVVSGGANGTANCMRVLMPLADGGQFNTFYDLSSRENWPNNARPVVGGHYELVFWVRTDNTTPETLAVIPRVNNHVATWLWDSVRGILPSAAWEDYFDDSLDDACNKENDVNFADCGIVNVTTEWTKHVFEFDVTEAAAGQPAGYQLHNTHIGISMITFMPNAYVYFDGFAINEIEQ